MRDEKELWSDDFDIVEDAEMMPAYYEDGVSPETADDHRTNARPRAAWQRIEDRFEELKLRASFCDWNDWDEDYPLEH